MGDRPSAVDPATGEANGRTVMQYVYVLKSEKDQKLYVGCTQDIGERLKEHNAGRVRSTKGRKPFQLLYTEEYPDKYEAFRQERFYKTPTGKSELRKKIWGIV